MRARMQLHCFTLVFILVSLWRLQSEFSQTVVLVCRDASCTGGEYSNLFRGKKICLVLLDVDILMRLKLY